MKSKFTMMVLCGVLLFSVHEIFAQSTNAMEAFKRGIAAYNNEKYVEALPYLKQAALAGISDAYAPLINMYSDGDYDGSGKGNYREAFTWLLMAQNKYISLVQEGKDDSELAVVCMMNYDPLCFLIGDYEEIIDHVTYGYNKGMPKIPYVIAQLAASYLKLGKISKANEWLNNAMSLATEKNDEISMHTINALRSKIALDKKEYSNALEYSKDAAYIGKVPLAAYVYGVALIKTMKNPQIGQKWVKLAAEYDYNGLFEINCYEDEIKQYWNSIKNIEF